RSVLARAVGAAAPARGRDALGRRRIPPARAMIRAERRAESWPFRIAPPLRPHMTEPLFPPKPQLAERAHVPSIERYRETYRRSIEDSSAFWAEQSKRLHFHRPFERIRHEDFTQANFRWFEGAQLNVAYNCIDRHLPEKANDTAIIWAGDHLGDYRHITYQELHENVCRMANVLARHGVRKGDRVCLYMPMIPEVAYAMLACARLGAIHSVVFAGFSADSLRDRILDAGCKVVVTANEGLRGGKP